MDATDAALQELVASMGVTACDAGSLEALRLVAQGARAGAPRRSRRARYTRAGVGPPRPRGASPPGAPRRPLARSLAAAETARVVATAGEIALALGQGAIGPDAVRLACNAHQLLQPQSRERAMELARAHNSRQLAWPLGAAVVVPAHQAAAAACVAPGAVIEAATAAWAPGLGAASARVTGGGGGGGGGGEDDAHALRRPAGAPLEAPIRVQLPVAAASAAAHTGSGARGAPVEAAAAAGAANAGRGAASSFATPAAGMVPDR
jgi:hypothetical protein